MNVGDDWGVLAKDSFNFALAASQKYKNGSPEEKKTIVKTVGSNVVSLYQMLQFQPRFLFLKYREGIEKTKQEISRLVLNNSLQNQANLKNYVQSCIWYPRRDSNPQPGA